MTTAGDLRCTERRLYSPKYVEGEFFEVLIAPVPKRVLDLGRAPHDDHYLNVALRHAFATPRLTMGGMVTAINAVVGTVRRRRLDGIGLLVVAEIALSIALLLITEDPRI